MRCSLTHIHSIAPTQDNVKLVFVQKDPPFRGPLRGEVVEQGFSPPARYHNRSHSVDVV